jgi:hypothetical protein
VIDLVGVAVSMWPALTVRYWGHTRPDLFTLFLLAWQTVPFAVVAALAVGVRASVIAAVVAVLTLATAATEIAVHSASDDPLSSVAFVTVPTALAVLVAVLLLAVSRGQ